MRHGWLALALFLPFGGDDRPRPDDPSLELTAPNASADSVNIDPKAGDSLEKVLKEDPVQFLKLCLAKYDAEIKSYSVTFEKQERPLGGKLLGKEKIAVAFREEPYSVSMKWLKGAGRAAKVLYVEGENDDLMLVRPAGFIGLSGIWKKDPVGDEAKATGRYSIKQFGFRRSTQRTLGAMIKARERGALHVRYEGVVAVPELGGQLCYKIVRKPYEPLEEDGLAELTLYFDREHLLQVGSQLRGKNGENFGDYFFYDVKLNPTFDAKQFVRDSL